MTLYFIMKCKFYSKNYTNCEFTKSKLEILLNDIPKEKKHEFLKIKAKIMIYGLFLNFINDDLEESINSVLKMIELLSPDPENTNELSLEEKALFFFKYIKGFLSQAGIDKTKKFELFAEEYKSMIVTQTNNISYENNKEEYTEPVKKIKKSFSDSYKAFFNSKLRTTIYESLDKEFYLIKYNKTDDKVMEFLEKHMHTYVRDNNRQKLFEDFNMFIVLNKRNIKNEFDMTMAEIVHEQKRRIEAFDIIFSNIVGAFSHIFKEFFYEDKIGLNFRKTGNNNKNNNISININELAKELKTSKIVEENKITEIKQKKNKKGNNKSDSLNLNKEFTVPPNTEEMDKILLYNISVKQKKIREKNNLLLNNKDNSKSISNNFSKKFTKNTNNSKMTDLKNNSNEINLSKNISNLNESQKLIKKTNNNCRFILRNINNFLITKLISLFTPTFKLQNNFYTDPKTGNDYVEIFPGKKDLINYKISNCIKSHYGHTLKGIHSVENQDRFFYYENFMLIKNCTLFGVCDGHGKNGGQISDTIGILFPAYWIYLCIDDNLIRKNQDINELMIKLFKIEESPLKIKDIFILRYIFNKLGLDYSHIPFLNNDLTTFHNKLYETIYYCHNDLKQRFRIDIDNSGTTFCSGILLGNILYIINIGDSRAVLGSFNIKENDWKAEQLSIDHEPNSPNEYRRIIQCNGRVDKLKNEFGEEMGPPRVFDKDTDSTSPGIAMSRSIGDDIAKKLGVIYEPEVFFYELNFESKILVIGSDGLWGCMSNEEVIEFLGDCYDDNIKVEQAAEMLVERAKNKRNENYSKSKKEYYSMSKSDKNGKKGKKNKNDSDFYDSTNEKETTKISFKNYDDITCIVIYLDIE